MRMEQVSTGLDRNPETIGPWIRVRRIRAGLTQRQLADFSTLSVRAIRDIENGRVRSPRLDTLRLLAKVLHFDAPQPAVNGPPEPEGVRPPVAHGPLIGRDDELATLIRLWDTEPRQTIAITGIAGVGKTRLALELAGAVRRRNGWSILWVPLTDTPQSWHWSDSSVARLSVRLAELARQGLGGARRIAEYVGERPGLLVLDAVPRPMELVGLTDLLSAYRPELRVLITVRNPGGITDTALFPLAPLPVPDSGAPAGLATLRQVPSARMFLDQAARVRPGFTPSDADLAAVARICRALDGLPAALELAARWTFVYSPQQLARQLAADPLLLTKQPAAGSGGGPALVESIRSAIGRLTARQRHLLTVMAGHGGSWSIADAATWTGSGAQNTADDVYALLLHGLIRRQDHTGQSRFELLNMVGSLREP